MRRVYQDKFGTEEGNCMSATVASLLELNLKDVPNFSTKPDPWQATMSFMRDRGYSYEGTLVNQNYEEHATGIMPTGTFRDLRMLEGLGGYFLGIVISPFMWGKTGNAYWLHAVVVDRRCRIVHDPNPRYKNLKSYPLAKEIGYNGVIEVYKFKKS